MYARHTHTHTHTHTGGCKCRAWWSTYCLAVWGTRNVQHTATHYKTLQHTAIHCNTLQHSATHCNTLPQADLTLWKRAAHRNTLDNTAIHCNTLRYTATHCNTLQVTATHCKGALEWMVSMKTCVKWRVGSLLLRFLRKKIAFWEMCLFSREMCLSSLEKRNVPHTERHRKRTKHIVTHCYTLQHTATHRNTLQNTTTNCDTLQHTATHCNTLPVSSWMSCVCENNFLFPVLQTARQQARTPSFSLWRGASLLPRCLKYSKQKRAAHSNTLQHTQMHCTTMPMSSWRNRVCENMHEFKRLLSARPNQWFIFTTSLPDFRGLFY